MFYNSAVIKEANSESKSLKVDGNEILVHLFRNKLNVHQKHKVFIAVMAAFFRLHR